MPDSPTPAAPQPPFDAASYVDLAAAVVGLPIPGEARNGVIDNFEKIWAIARPVVEFPLPDELESAPTFKP